MKWDYEVEHLRELVAAGQPVQGDVVEALRAIAEQLERGNDLLERVVKGRILAVTRGVPDELGVAQGKAPREPPRNEPD